MRAGRMRDKLTFLQCTETQTPSGAVKKTWEPVYTCRAEYKRSSPVWDKDGTEAKEVFQGVTIYFFIRRTNRVTELMRVRYGAFLYEIYLIEPYYDDNTLRLTLRRVNE